VDTRKFAGTQCRRNRVALRHTAYEKVKFKIIKFTIDWLSLYSTYITRKPSTGPH